jgi:hypothetical protein
MKLPHTFLLVLSFLALFNGISVALDEDESRIVPFNGWKAIEVITEGDSKFWDWVMPAKFDGAGAFLVTPNIIRIHVNHENEEASISEVNVDKNNLKRAISNMIENDDIGNVKFVNNARLAYDRWTLDGGANWNTDLSPSRTGFCKLCSSQEYKPHTFGRDRGFVDQLYITGEECGGGALYVLKSLSRDLFQLSGFTGSSSDSIGGVPFDPWENAALIDTGETGHVALLLSPDGANSKRFLRLYIGQKGKNRNGSNANDFLSRNGLAYGEWFYLNAGFPSIGRTDNTGSFEKNSNGALEGGKLEDVDTNPNEPTKVVLAEQNEGLFIFNFNLNFNNDRFNSDASGFSLTKITSNDIRNPDNVEWSGNGRIFVNEDSARGAIWYSSDDGSSRTKIGETKNGGESSGIFDFSEFVDYSPGHIMVTTNQGTPSSMTILISPDVAPSFGSEGSIGSPIVDVGDADIYEAEDAIREQARVERKFSGYRGDGYIDMLGPSASLEWDVADLEEGAYEIYVSYASGNNNRPGHVYIDDNRVGTFGFKKTPSWTDWTVESKVLALSAGDHTLKLTAEPNIGPNIDWLGVRYIQAIASRERISEASSRYEVEDAVCDICTLESSRAGFSGGGYIDFGAQFAYAQWAISIPSTATYEVMIRYASGPDRPADLVVDGEKEADLHFQGSGGWQSWRTETVVMSLTEGIHIVKIDCGEKSSGPIVDWIAVHPVDSLATSPAPTLGPTAVIKSVAFGLQGVSFLFISAAGTATTTLILHMLL